MLHAWVLYLDIMPPGGRNTCCYSVPTHFVSTTGGFNGLAVVYVIPESGYESFTMLNALVIQPIYLAIGR